MLAVNPQNNAIRYRLGEVYLQQNNLPEALSTYEQLRQLEPQNLRLRLRLGLIYLEQKEVEKALETFQAVEVAGA